MYSTHTGEEFCIWNLSNAAESVPSPEIPSLLCCDNQANNSTGEGYKQDNKTGN